MAGSRLESLALVNGGSRGIGFEIARRLAEAGHQVIITGRNEDNLKTAKDELDHVGAVSALRADLMSIDDIDALFSKILDRYGRIDVLVNSAVASRVASFLELTEDDWETHLGTKLLGYIRCVRRALPPMIEQGWGRIVNLGGMTARVTGHGRMTNGVVNAGLTNFGKQLSDEVASKGVLINTVHPGYTMTQRLQMIIGAHAEETGVSFEEAEREFAEGLPIGRLVQVADVAAVVLFLCDPKNSAITGQAIAVDGGSGKSIPY
jgi:3-oxoacyl-[acyl-carrier protein] reductase